MAWLQNLAGKAEDLLNKFDQNAATVLNDSNQRSIEDLADPPTSSIIDISSDNNFIEINDPVDVDDNSSIPPSDVSVISDKSESNTFLHNSNSNVNLKYIAMDETLVKYEEKIASLEKENEQLREYTINVQHLHSELQNENSNLQSQLDRANETIVVTENKMEQYCARAQRMLKEKNSFETSKPDSSDVQLISYIEELKKDLEVGENKYEDLVAKFLKISNELTAVQQNFVSVQKENQSVVQMLQNSLGKEKKVTNTLEEECLLKAKNLQKYLDQVTKLQNSLKDKSNENLRLREMLKKTNHVVNQDLENRLQTLTQTLMSKQNNLEAVTTERNALCLQLEKLEQEYQKVIQLSQSQVKKPKEIESYEVGPNVPHFLKISPFDVGVTRQVKHAYSTLDAVSIRTGVFLRRYPLARVFVFCYMILLHVWVLIILCTDVPSSNVPS